MITRQTTQKQLAEMIKEAFRKTESHPPKENFILMSSSLAIALEYLGELSEKGLNYSRSRGGCLDSLVNNGITTTEWLEEQGLKTLRSMQQAFQEFAKNNPTINSEEDLPKINSVRDLFEILPEG